MSCLQRQLEELNLLKCSLLQGEYLSFALPPDDAEKWTALLDVYAMDGIPSDLEVPYDDLPPAKIRITSEGSPMNFEVEIPRDYGDPASESTSSTAAFSRMVSVRGDQITRAEQERWLHIVSESASQLSSSEYPIYELISVHILPRLHEETSAKASTAESTIEQSRSLQQSGTPRYHALLTSHHLVSPTKRRNMQNWSSQLSVTGFAKVGYPGVIYCEGDKEQVEEFVANIKGMQWLALKVRFVEPIPDAQAGNGIRERQWVEFEKVGGVVEEMRRIGRGSYIVEMGIGSTAPK